MAKVKNRNEKPKRVTVAELAVMVANGFAHMEEQLTGVEMGIRAEMNERFAQVEDRFQSVEMKILGTNNRIDVLIDRTPSREEFGRLEGRVTVLESRPKR